MLSRNDSGFQQFRKWLNKCQARLHLQKQMNDKRNCKVGMVVKRGAKETRANSDILIDGIDHMPEYDSEKEATRCKWFSCTRKMHNTVINAIHSFITEIYIAPLQGYYSEALPNLARLKRRVLRQE